MVALSARVNAMIQYEVNITIPFHDVDAMEIAWHGHYCKYFEVARGALLKYIDYDYPDMRSSGYAWPVIDLQIKYVKPCHYQQNIIVKVEIVEYENRLKMQYEIKDALTHERLTKGYSVQVAIDMSTSEMCLASPPILLEKLIAKGALIS